MYNLKVSDAQYLELAKDLKKHGEATQETLESFIKQMRVVRLQGAKDGAFAERMDMFIDHVELCSFKPGMYAEEFSSTISCYVDDIDLSDVSLY